MKSFLPFTLRFFFMLFMVSMTYEINWQPAKRADTLECGDLSTRLQDCWGEEFILEPPTCKDKNTLMDCAEILQEEFKKCPSDLSFRQILDSTVSNYRKIIKTICSNPELLTDFRHYNNCWSLAALCTKSMSVIVQGLIGSLSCRYAQESVDMCLTATTISFQGNPFDPKECVESQLPHKFARLIYDSIDCRSKEVHNCLETTTPENSISKSEPLNIMTFILMKSLVIYISL